MWWEICWLSYMKKRQIKKESNILKNISFTAVACLNFTILSFFTLMLMLPKKYYGDKMFTQNDKVNNYLGKWTSKSDVVSLNVKLNYFVLNVFCQRRDKQDEKTQLWNEVFTQPTGNTAPFFLFFTLKLNILKCISLNMRVVFWCISKKKREFYLTAVCNK